MPNSIVSINAPVQTNNASNVASASTLDDLLACVPRIYQPCFRPALRETHDKAVKLSHAQAALSSFERHQATGTFPPSILGALKAPVIQCSKEFATSSDFQTWTNSLDGVILENRKTILDNSIALKRKEIDYLQNLVSADTCKAVSLKIVKEQENLMASTFASGINQDGRTVYSTFFLEETTLSKNQGHVWLRKAMALGLAKHQRELVSKMTKLSIKKDTDVEMTGSLSSNDVKRTIDEAVARALNAHNRKNKPSKSLHGDLDSPELSNNRQTQSSSKESEKEAAGEGHCSQSRKRKGQWYEETEEEVKRLCLNTPSSFSVRNAFSYPDEFFVASSEARMKYVLLHSSVDFVNSLPEFRANVFKGPDVSLPKEIEIKLSLNGKYCLHQQQNNLLVTAAFQDLRRTIRIRAFYKDKKGSKGLYIPKFHVRSDWQPPNGPPGMEEAIDAMEAALLRQVSALPRKSYLRNPDTKVIKDFLTRSNYLVKITDKNLGLAVVTHTWYMNQCHAHLANTRAYLPRQIKLDQLQDEFIQLLQRFKWTPAVYRFLDTTKTEIPRFHVIPKVHKSPWSSRPIIPSHSWITSKASEVVDYYLQPVIKRTWPILDSTRSFVTTLRDATKDIDLTDCWLLTGDVTAMYTNIPPDDAISAVTEILTEERKKHRSNTSEGLIALLQFVLKNNYFKFLDDTFVQISGLAMGTACAPAVANIYCAKHEEDLRSEVRNTNHPGWIYYGRYVDDIFAIFKGTKEELEAQLKWWVIPPLHISWEMSQQSLSFLDVRLYIENGRLVTTLFEKGLNQHMYVPFSSAHPLSVKKGMVKAERTRYRMICSKEQDVFKCERHLRSNLLRRGYPLHLLNSWFRLPVITKAREDKILLLPSHYNPVWENISMNKLEDAFYGAHPMEPAVGENLRRIFGKLTLGLKRGWNMYDIYDRGNLTILTASMDLEDSPLG
jgi:hypothetical protein